MSSDNRRRLAASIIQFLTNELYNTQSELNQDSKDSIEVAAQCLGAAFDVNPVDGSLLPKKTLIEIFTNYLEKEETKTEKPQVTEAEKEKANDLKNIGNEFMKLGKYQEALEAYTKAIEIDDSNPIYYCNRAAAHSKMDNHHAALEDCRIAVKNDPNYSKAYCRMGLAYVHLKDNQRARDCYKKAVELDPSESNISNLNLAEEKIKEEETEQYESGLGNFANSVFGNPYFMNMAQQVLANPNVQNMFTQMMSNGLGQQQNDPNVATPNLENTDLSAFLKAGKEFAEKIKAQNPEIVEQLKEVFNKASEEENKGSDKQEKNEDNDKK